MLRISVFHPELCLTGLIVLIVTPVAANGQCPDDWLPGDAVQGVGSQVFATAVWDPAGPGPQQEQLVVGGSFQVAGDIPADRIAAWDGSSWQPLGTGMNDRVEAITVYEGQLIAGGVFTTAGGVSVNNIARWDGEAWHPLGTGVDKRVRVLAVHDGELIAGGDFLVAGGMSAKYTARWNGSEWQPLGNGTHGLVRALTVYDGELIAGGNFNFATLSLIARWDGTTW